MSGRLRVCVVGAGYFSRFHYDAWQRLDEVDVAALCALTQEEARAAAARFGVPRWYDDLDTMLDAERPDLLDIVTPPAAHRACIDAAITRSIPAICQKPFCGTLAEAEAAAAAIDGAGATVVVHENFRFQPWYGRIARAIGQGELGEVYQATFRLRPGDGQGPDAYLDRQPYFQAMERFLVHETAIHLLDVFRYLLGEPETVLARLARLNPAIAGEDAGIILLEFPGGVRALFDGNRLVDHAADDRRLTMGEMLVEGSAAVMRLDGWGRLWRRARGETVEQEIAYDWVDRGFGGDSVYRLQKHVVEHLLRGTALQNRASDYLANLALEEAAYRSARDGRIMPAQDAT